MMSRFEVLVSRFRQLLFKIAPPIKARKPLINTAHHLQEAFEADPSLFKD